MRKREIDALYKNWNNLIYIRKNHIKTLNIDKEYDKLCGCSDKIKRNEIYKLVFEKIQKLKMIIKIDPITLMPGNDRRSICRMDCVVKKAGDFGVALERIDYEDNPETDVFNTVKGRYIETHKSYEKSELYYIDYFQIEQMYIFAYDVELYTLGRRGKPPIKSIPRKKINQI